MKTLNIFGKEIFSYGEPVSAIHSKMYSGTMAASSDYAKPLNVKQLGNTVLAEPLLYKAIVKKNFDTVRNWFEIKTIEDGKEVPKFVLKLIHEFNERNNFKRLLAKTGVSANIYGTGFIERTYIGEEEPDLSSKPNPDRKPLGLILQNSENITERRPRKYSRGKNRKVKYWICKSQKSGQEIEIHPDRLQDVSIDSLPNSPFGISKVNIVRNILHSKMDSDVSSGEILNWFGSGLYDVMIQNMDEEQRKATEKKLASHPDFLIHDQDYELDVKNPTRIDPAPFYNYFYTNIAAVMVMPTHMLTGATPGNVTGSEVGFSDYIHDIENIQEVVYTPLIVKLYKHLLNTHGHTWKYKVDWNPCFIDELSEAKILQTRSFSAVQNVNAGIIDIKEARIMLNEGVMNLVPGKIPKKPIQPVIVPTGTEPNTEPQPAVKPKQDKPKMDKDSEEVEAYKEQVEFYNELIAQDNRVRKAGSKYV